MEVLEIIENVGSAHEEGDDDESDVDIQVEFYPRELMSHVICNAFVRN